MRKACRLLFYSSAISILKTDGLGEHRLVVFRASPDICGLLLGVNDGFWSFSSKSWRLYTVDRLVLMMVAPIAQW